MDDSVYTPYMQMMGIPSQYYPMLTAPQQQLEMMYPRIYFIIHPRIRSHCDMMDMTYGVGITPTREQLDSMTDAIYRDVEMDVDAAMAEERSDNEETRQFGFFGRRFLRDLIGILLIRDLLRRRRFYGGYPYGGYYGPGYGYPGFGYGPGFGY